MASPNIINNNAFDAGSVTYYEPYRIAFQWNGVKKYGSILYIEETNRTNKLQGNTSNYHPITSETVQKLNLKNGNTYHATLTLIDFDGNAISSPTSFLLYCFSVPDISIQGFSENSTQIIHNTSVELILNETRSSSSLPIKSYHFEIADSSQNVIASSPTMYKTADASTEDFSDIKYTFDSLVSDSEYTVSVKAITEFNMSIEKSYKINVLLKNYVHNAVTTVPLKNGNISFNIVSAAVQSNLEDGQYNGSQLDLSNGGVATYRRITVPRNFTFFTKVQLKQIDIENNIPLITFLLDDQSKLFVRTKYIDEYQNFKIQSEATGILYSSFNYYDDDNVLQTAYKYIVSRRLIFELVDTLTGNVITLDKDIKFNLVDGKFVYNKLTSYGVYVQKNDNGILFDVNYPEQLYKKYEPKENEVYSCTLGELTEQNIPALYTGNIGGNKTPNIAIQEMKDAFKLSFNKYLYLNFERNQYIAIPDDSEAYFEYDTTSGFLKFISEDKTYYVNSYISWLSGWNNLWIRQETVKDDGYMYGSWYGNPIKTGVKIYTNLNIGVYSNGTIRFYNDNLKEKF